MLSITDLLLLAFPVTKTYRTLKYPRLKLTKHWLSFWLIYFSIQLITTLTFNQIPFWNTISTLIILFNYSPTVSEISFKFLTTSIKHLNSKSREITLPPKVRTFYHQYLIPTLSQLRANEKVQMFLLFLKTNGIDLTKPESTKED